MQHHIYIRASKLAPSCGSRCSSACDDLLPRPPRLTSQGTIYDDGPFKPSTKHPGAWNLAMPQNCKPAPANSSPRQRFIVTSLDTTGLASHTTGQQATTAQSFKKEGWCKKPYTLRTLSPKAPNNYSIIYPTPCSNY